MCAIGQTAAKIREIGNDRFKENKFAEAVAKYDKCLRYLTEEFPSPDEEKQLKEARLPVLLNRAACQVVLDALPEVARVSCSSITSFTCGVSGAGVQLKLKRNDLVSCTLPSRVTVSSSVL